VDRLVCRSDQGDGKQGIKSAHSVQDRAGSCLNGGLDQSGKTSWCGGGGGGLWVGGVGVVGCGGFLGWVFLFVGGGCWGGCEGVWFVVGWVGGVLFVCVWVGWGVLWCRDLKDLNEGRKSANLSCGTSVGIRTKPQIGRQAVHLDVGNLRVCGYTFVARWGRGEDKANNGKEYNRAGKLY